MGAKILLRIDDLDQERAKGRYVQDIILKTPGFHGTKLCLGPKKSWGIWKDEMVHKSHRMEQYQAALEGIEWKEAGLCLWLLSQKIQENGFQRLTI